MHGSWILDQLFDSKYYQFHRNLVSEPEAAKAALSFITGKNKNQYLTTSEVTVAADWRLNLFAFYLDDLSNFIEIIRHQREKLLRTIDWRWGIFMMSPEEMKKYFSITASAGVLNYLCFSPILNHFNQKILPVKSEHQLAGTMLSIAYFALNIACKIAYIRYIAAIHTIGSTTPLHRAAANNDEEKVHQLLQAGADINRCDNSWRNIFEILPADSALQEQYANIKAGIPTASRYTILNLFEERLQDFQGITRQAAICIQRQLQHFKPIHKNVTYLNIASCKQLLRAAVENGNSNNTQMILDYITHENLPLSLDEQTELFYAAPSIAVLQTLLLNGLDFRGYLIKLYQEKNVIENAGMGAGLCQQRINIMHKLLPHFKEEELESLEGFEGENCPITISVPSHPVRIDNSRANIAFELDALLDWIKNNNFSHPLSREKFDLLNIIFDHKKFMQINEHVKIPLTNEKLQEPSEKLRLSAEIGTNLANSIQKIARELINSNARMHLYIFILQKIAPNAVVSALVYGQKIPYIALALHWLKNIRSNLSNPFYSNAFLAKFNGYTINAFVWHGVIKELSSPETSKLVNHDGHPNSLINLFYLLATMHTFGMLVNLHAPAFYSDEDSFEFNRLQPEQFVTAKHRFITPYWQEVLQRQAATEPANYQTLDTHSASSNPAPNFA